MPATIIDSSILIDLIDPESDWTGWSRSRLAEMVGGGGALLNVVIAAEVSHGFATRSRLDAFFQSTPLAFEDIPEEAGTRAGWAHRQYRQRGGARERTLPDFLIGAHAEVMGHDVLTRDPHGFRSYFPDLPIIAPDTHP